MGKGEDEDEDERYTVETASHHLFMAAGLVTI
jgi:hypothetical protein